MAVPVARTGWLVALGLAWLLAELAFWAPGDRIAWSSPCGEVVLGSGSAKWPNRDSGSLAQRHEVELALRGWAQETFFKAAPFAWEAQSRIVFLGIVSVPMLSLQLEDPVILGWGDLVLLLAIAAIWRVAGVPRGVEWGSEQGNGCIIPVRGGERPSWSLIGAVGCFMLGGSLVIALMLISIPFYAFIAVAAWSPLVLSYLLLLVMWFPSGHYFAARIYSDKVVLAGHFLRVVYSADALRESGIRAVRPGDAQRLEHWTPCAADAPSSPKRRVSP